MTYTTEDFQGDYIKEHFRDLMPEEQEEVLQSLPPEKRLAGLTVEQIRQYLEQMTARRAGPKRKAGRTSHRT